MALQFYTTSDSWFLVDGAVNLFVSCYGKTTWRLRRLWLVLAWCSPESKYWTKAVL